jgi:hypothetical protein
VALFCTISASNLPFQDLRLLVIIYLPHHAGDAARIDTLYAIAQALDLKLEELLKGF